MIDKQCEELLFPVLFPKGIYEYSSGQQVAISPVKNFKYARLQHYSGRFTTNPDYLLFA